jgi:hypothetical protein
MTEEQTPALTLPDIQTVPIDTVVPYWRNPRNVTTEAVGAIAESISRYGYQQPIVVDHERVIIIGHTRYAALRRLGATDVQVAIAKDLSPQKVKELRVIDNKSGEFSLWDFEKLQEELATTDTGSMAGFFDVLADADQANTTVDTTGASGDFYVEEPEPQDQVDLACPHCFHSFTKTVTKDQIMAGRLS